MKSTQSTLRKIHRVGLLLTLPILIALSDSGLSQSEHPGVIERPKPPERTLGEADSEWPDVKFQVTQIQRINSGHLLVTIRLVVGPDAANPTFIGIEPSGGLKAPKDAPTEELASGKYDPTPFSLQKATLSDEATQQKYTALPGLPAQPFLGPNALMTTLRPGSWIQLAVQFPAPPPPPADAVRAKGEQKATLWLPKAKTPIKHLAIPQD